jgi:Protein of unknown function (DUF2924)
VSEELEADIQALPKMNINELRAKWKSALKQQPPLHIRKQLMVPLLAYKLQEQAYGGLKPSVKRRLRELAKSFEKGGPTKLPRRIKPGTRLIRQWQDETHQVTVEALGFEYKGKRYNSLSEVARLITGTQWSGPLFFGLKGKKRCRLWWLFWETNGRGPATRETSSI